MALSLQCYLGCNQAATRTLTRTDTHHPLHDGSIRSACHQPGSSHSCVTRPSCHKTGERKTDSFCTHSARLAYGCLLIQPLNTSFTCPSILPFPSCLTSPSSSRLHFSPLSSNSPTRFIRPFVIILPLFHLHLPSNSKRRKPFENMVVAKAHSAYFMSCAKAELGLFHVNYFTLRAKRSDGLCTFNNGG